MKHTLIFMAFFAFTSPAVAGCYADYKAKHVNGSLSLHYGVMAVPDNHCAAPTPYMASKLSARGWQLLRVLSTFDEGGLTARRKNAGAYYLAF